MLMNRSRGAVTTKQALMADQIQTKPISSLLGSPRFFNAFSSKIPSDAENNLISPTSIFVNPFSYDTTLPKTPTPSPKFNKSETEAIGLALIDSLITKEKNDGNFNISKPINRMVLLGSKLKVQIPATTPPSPAKSPESPADFGIKTRNSQMLISPFLDSPVKDFSRQMSLKEMELSEDYTCVISHGPNPKTTHIFDDCVVESCCDEEDVKNFDHEKMEFGVESDVSISESVDFLSFCYTCKDSLEQGKDIYIYRGEKAFCSHECRCKEMVYEGITNPELDDDAL